MTRGKRSWDLVARGLAVLLFLTVLAGPAWAQGGAGVRAGVSVDPDQFYFGGHVEMGPIVERLWFRPNLELGVGDHRTLLALNGEFAYWFDLRNPDWKLYVGAGPGLNMIRFDRDRFGREDTRAEGGFHILLGLAHEGGVFTEIKVGALHSAEIKLGVGYTFR